MSGTATVALVNPFVGLRSFEESEDYLFFGRGKQIDELLAKLNDSRFLSVIGSSGSGKSSLVKSGLMPAIYSGFMTVGSSWRVTLMQPGENPLGYLARQLAVEKVLHVKEGFNDDIPHETIIEASLRRSENGLVQVYKDAHLPANEHLLIVVDQFEELFRFSKYEKDNKFGKSDAMHFVQILLTASQQLECPIYVLLTMRADFLGDCSEFRGLPEAINKGQYLVPRMTRDEIREAIIGPVAVSGATITQRLVTRLLNDVNNDTDQLPVLQHAMMRTWQAWNKRNQFDKPIDFVDYDSIGTMSGALSIHADEAYNELTDGKEKQVCELMFKALTDKAADKRGTRRPRSVADLMLLTDATQQEVYRIVDVFRKPGRTFLMPPPSIPLHTDSIIDISHESLMRVWDRLEKWTIEEGRNADQYIRLANSANLKEQEQEDLLKNPALAIALKWKDDNKPTAKWAEAYKGDFKKTMDFLEESKLRNIADEEEKEEQAKQKLILEKKAARRKYINWILTLMGIILFIAVFSGMRYYWLSKKNATLAEQAIISQKEATNNAKEANKLRREADVLKNIAIEKAIDAEKQSDTAKQQSKIAKLNALEAEVQKRIAQDSAQEAKKQREIANINEVEAKKQRDNVANQNLKIAANEYARLIREGPTNKIKIENDTFDYKLIAYCDHLDSLGNLIKDSYARKEYQKLKERIYFNNDLYEKTYACFETVTSSKPKKAVFDKSSYNVFFENETDTSSDIYRQLYEQIGNKIVAIVNDKTGRRTICSSSDNWLYVFTNKNGLLLENKIPLGAKVTALDYNREKEIIYFGLETGDIGYISYNKDRRNQPVFENSLGSAVTAIQLFRCAVSGESNYFLLAAAKKSRVVVYELDNNNLVPDKKLLGNILPEKNLLDVVSARFVADAKDNKKIVIKVRSVKGGISIYAWNPFTAEILREYKRSKDLPDVVKKKYFDQTNYYK